MQTTRNGHSRKGPPATKLERLRRALSFAFPYRRVIAAIFVVTLIVALLNAAEPLIIKYIFDGLGTPARAHVLWSGVAILIGIALLREVGTAFSNWKTWHARLGIHYSLLEKTIERLHRMPLSLHRSEGVGATMIKLDRGVQGFVGAITQVLFNVFPAFVYLVLALVVMIRLNWQLAVIVCCFLPLPAIIAALAGPEQNRRERALLDRWSKIYSRFNEVLSGIVTVRSFSMEDAEKQRFLGEVNKANRVVIRGVGIDTGLGAATNLVVAAARIAAIALGGMFILKGKITVGTLLAFLGYVGGLFGPVQGLTTVYQTIQKAYVSLDDIFTIIDVQDSLGDAPNARDVNHVHGNVEFKGVRFRYEEVDRPILEDLSLRVTAGEKLAIVGPSGSGKTTMMALLMRFYDPREGTILLDGHDLRNLKQRSLRRNIGTVLHDPLLFNDSIRNNIAYGKPEATMEEVEEAARAANAHAFINHLPDRYDTEIGERGSRLSVGERQRVAIARALLKDPPILVLDEATSSLDPESEAVVQEALDRLIENRTTFVIAHRLATVVNADRIIVLKNGRITECGRHEELMKARGYYSTLVERQTRGLIRNDGE